MRRIELEGHKLDIFDSIDDMPIARFHRFSRNLLVESGIGGTVADVDRHLMRTIEFLKSNDSKSAIKELENLRQGVHLVENGISPKGLAFASIVYAIDGETVTDLTDDNLVKIMERLGSMTVRELSQLIEEVKKKIDEEIRLYFPSLFDDSMRKEYFAKMKRLLLMKIEDMQKNVNSEAIEALEREIVTFSKPRDFGGDKGVEIAFDKEYESTCITIGSELHLDAKKMTVMEYYHAIEYLKERARKMEETKHRK